MAVEGDYLDVPRLLEPEGFVVWKALIEINVKAKSERLWRIIKVGDYIPQKLSPYGNGTMIVKPESEWSVEDETRVRENRLAMHYLYCALPDKEFKKIYSCTTAHDIWETLTMIHEGNSELKECKIGQLNQKLETFRMHKNESIDEMYARYQSVKCDLELLGKEYTDEVHVERFLSALRPNWEVLVNIIRLTKNLSLYPLIDLFWNLKMSEDRIKREN